MTDRSGFDCFVHARGAALARTAYLLTGDHHLAEDLAQSALVQAAEHWERTHTSPWREFLLPLPPEPMSFAVDLIPDLDGDPDQGLTYDFVAHGRLRRWPRPIVAAGRAALLVGIAFVRMLQRWAS